MVSPRLFSLASSLIVIRALFEKLQSLRLELFEKLLRILGEGSS